MNPKDYFVMLETGSIRQRVAAFIAVHGNIDGGHHKQWVLDQVLRMVCGAEAYPTVRKYIEIEYGEWDEGIAP